MIKWASVCKTWEILPHSFSGKFISESKFNTIACLSHITFSPQLRFAIDQEKVTGSQTKTHTGENSSFPSKPCGISHVHRNSFAVSLLKTFNFTVSPIGAELQRQSGVNATTLTHAVRERWWNRYRTLLLECCCYFLVLTGETLTWLSSLKHKNNERCFWQQVFTFRVRNDIPAALRNNVFV